MESIDVRRKIIKVTLVLEDGKEHSCSIREMTGEQKDEYLDFYFSGVEISEDTDESRAQDDTEKETKRKIKINSSKGVRGKLLSLCLYDENNTLILPEVISNFSDSAINALCKIARELNGFEKDAEDKAEKN